MKKFLKILLCIVLALLLIFIGYVAYVFISYHRIDDKQTLEITTTDNALSNVSADTQYRITSANLGFGAYSADYSFFMDGGTESWAYSKDAVIENITGSTNAIIDANPDFMLFQEVDLDSTRSYHVDQEALITDILNDNNNALSYTFAINYDSPFLMYPITQPHGKSKAGMLTVSPATITESVRRSLPIEEGLSKFIDLDRCYSKNYVEVDNGKKLVLYNVHLSAYTTDPSTADNQVKMLNEDMAAEFEAGNYIIAGGDMNKDMLGDSSKYFGASDTAANWAMPFPAEFLDDDFTVIGPIDYDNPVPTCRNADTPYTSDSFVLSIDGFIVSSNVEVVESKVIDTEFKYSDHNPVYMDFILK